MKIFFTNYFLFLLSFFALIFYFLGETNINNQFVKNISVFENYELFGNLVSSSIPNLLKEHLPFKSNKPIILSGFGVGLSHSSIILKKNK